MAETEGEVEEHHITVTRTARYAALGRFSDDVTEVWIVCHGHAQLAREFLESFRCIASAQRLIVAPEALSRFYLDGGFRGGRTKVGATWMTTEDREAEIADYVAYLDAVCEEVFKGHDRNRVALRVLGFSQGATTVLRWAAAGNARPDQVIVWAGSLPAELAVVGATRLIDVGRPLVLVAGERDKFITSAILEAQAETLKGFGIPLGVKRFEGDHEIDPGVLSAIANDW